VWSPEGGAAASSLPFQITPAPSLTVNTTTAASGSPLTVTLTGGLGGASDWLAFASSTAANNSYLQYVFVGAGVTSRTWTVTAPNTGGTYEFRLFLNNGYVRAATSPAIAVSAGPNPVPAITSLSPTRVIVGSASTVVTVTGTGFVSSSMARLNGNDRPTTVTGTTQLRMTLSAADLSVIGTSQVTIFNPSPGGGVSNAATFDVVAPPQLTVNATQVARGSPITVTLTGGLGGSSDWIAFAATGAANNSYLSYVYIGNGVTTRTWVVTAPSTAGTYEFRMFLNNGYVRVATSPPVTVN
jgi:hypothetical protein